MVAPSAMMDGQVAAIRHALDAAGHPDTPIMAYSTKFASAFYGPFRVAAGCELKGDRKTYQMDPMNGREALRESLQDEAEGADMLMVKPGLAYLDVLARLRERTLLPIAVYQVQRRIRDDQVRRRGRCAERGSVWCARRWARSSAPAPT